MWARGCLCAYASVANRTLMDGFVGDSFRRPCRLLIACPSPWSPYCVASPHAIGIYTCAFTVARRRTPHMAHKAGSVVCNALIVQHWAA